MQLPILGHFHYLGAMYKIVVFINFTLTLCHNISKKVIWTLLFGHLKFCLKSFGLIPLCCKPVVKLRDCRNLLTTNRIQSLDQEANSMVLGDHDVRSRRRKFSGPLLKWKSRRGASSFASSSFSSFSAQEIALQSWVVEATTFFFWVSRPGNTSNGEMIVVISIDLEIRGKYYDQPKDNIERSSLESMALRDIFQFSPLPFAILKISLFFFYIDILFLNEWKEVFCIFWWGQFWLYTYVILNGPWNDKDCLAMQETETMAAETKWRARHFWMKAER